MRLPSITDATSELVNRIRDGNIPDTAFATVDAPCPKCGSAVFEHGKSYVCEKSVPTMAQPSVNTAQ